MSIWKRILYWIGLRSNPGPRYYKFSESMQVTLRTLAKHDGQPENQLAQDLVAAGLSHYYSTGDFWSKWEALTPRERDVTALICLGYTNQEICRRLVIAPGTVKTHVANVFRKFQVNSRHELRILLSNWDFSAWGK